jgi:hypothetical protein
MLRPFLPAGGLLLASGLLLAAVVSAQPFSGDGAAGPTVQVLSASYYLIDFAYDGEERPPETYDYAAPAFGLTYARPNLLATLAFGNQEAGAGVDGRQLLDVAFTTWGGFSPFAALAAGPTRLYVPVLLHSNYRRVSPEGSESILDDFSVALIGLGTGLGLAQRLGAEALVEARVNPIIGLASSSLADAFGHSRLLDVDAQLHLGALFGGAGLSAGYTFRLQHWNVNASDLLPDVTAGLLDYRGRLHLFRVGVNW